MTGTPAPLRPTRQRRAISEALAGAAEFQSAQDIHDALRQAGDGLVLKRKIAGDLLPAVCDWRRALNRRKVTGNRVHRC